MGNNNSGKAEHNGGAYWIVFAAIFLVVLADLLLNQITVSRMIIFAVILLLTVFLKKYITRQRCRFQVLYWVTVAALVCTASIIIRPSVHDIYLNDSGKESFTDPVKTEYGQVKGIYNKNMTIREFAGIPYAKPPVGDLRWKAPQSPAPWKGERICDHFSDCEVQSNLPTPITKLMYLTMKTDELSHASIKDNEKTSEDCLYLNIWTGAKSAKEQRPVIVYIHGGSFTMGSGSIEVYNGENMAKKGAVFVTINYRLGIFGFYANPQLSKESGYGASGNYGILDQIEALKWVKHNISSFGGDADNVTVAGESAGSMSVSILQASPLAKGLFQHVIAESGGYFGSQGYKHAPMETLASAEKDGINLEHFLKKSSIAQLRQMSASDLLNASKAISTRPVFDGYVLKDTVYNTFAKGRENNVPALLGSNANESTLWMSLPWPVSISPDYSPMSTSSFHQAVNGTYGNFANRFFKLYPTDNKNETLRSEMDSSTAQWFAWHMHTWAKLQSSKTNSKVYYYYFDRVQPGPSALRTLGAYHSSEIAYAYGNLNKIDLPYTDSDYKLSDVMLSYWFNFARSGNPNSSGLPYWEPYNINTDLVMQLGNTLRMIPVPNKNDLSFFDKFEAALRTNKR